jgi:hypothetical protein
MRIGNFRIPGRRNRVGDAGTSASGFDAPGMLGNPTFGGVG